MGASTRIAPNGAAGSPGSEREVQGRRARQGRARRRRHDSPEALKEASFFRDRRWLMAVRWILLLGALVFPVSAVVAGGQGGAGMAGGPASANAYAHNPTVSLNVD